MQRTSSFGLWSGTCGPGGGFVSAIQNAADLHLFQDTMMQKRALSLVITASMIALVACGDDDDSTSPTVSKILDFTATMTPANEPSVTGNPTGNGTFTASLDTSTNEFTYSGTFTGLTANV